MIGDVNPEEIIFLSGVIPGKAAWRFLLSHWGTDTLTATLGVNSLNCRYNWMASAAVYRRMAKTTVTCRTTAMKLTGGETLWLNPASCLSARSLNSEEVRRWPHTHCAPDIMTVFHHFAFLLSVSVFKWVRKTLIALVQVTFGRTINKYVQAAPEVSCEMS